MPSNRPLKLDDLKKPELSEGDNPFADADGQDGDPHAPADYRGAYVTSQRSRGNRLLVLAIVAVLGAPLLFLAAAWDPLGILLGLIGWLTALVVSLPVIVLGLKDLQAMNLEAITSQQKWQTQAAIGLAAMALVTCIIIPVYFFAF